MTMRYWVFHEEMLAVALAARDTPPCFSPECLEMQRRQDNRAKSAQNTNRKLGRLRRREDRPAAERVRREAATQEAA